jgi:hypothetical protein
MTTCAILSSCWLHCCVISCPVSNFVSYHSAVHLAPAFVAVALVFSHRVSGANNPLEYFDGIASALNASGNVSAATHKFSQLNALDSFRDVDGALHLRMTWIGEYSSCVEILAQNPGAPSGTYTIVTSNFRLLSVWCDMTTDGGGYDIMKLEKPSRVVVIFSSHALMSCPWMTACACWGSIRHADTRIILVRTASPPILSRILPTMAAMRWVCHP